MSKDVADVFTCCSEFDEIIKALKWPFTSLSTAPPLSTTSDDYSRLETAFILLLKLQELYPFNKGVMSNTRPFCALVTIHVK